MQVEAIKKNDHYEIPELENLKINKDRVTLYFDYESYLEEDKNLEYVKPEMQSGTLQAKFNEILGEYAKKRANVSIGEDKKLYSDALWDRYGQ